MFGRHIVPVNRVVAYRVHIAFQIREAQNGHGRHTCIGWNSRAWPGLQRYIHDALVLGAHLQGFAMARYRARKEAIGESAQALSASEFHYSQRRADVRRILFHSDRQYLRIGQSGNQLVELSSAMMEDAILEGANPQIAVAAGEGGNMRTLEARVELREPAAVEYQ
jgi:hypothetical protein